MERREDSIDLKDVIFLLLKWWWLLAIFAVLFPVAAYFYTDYTYVPRYTAAATMVVNSQQIKIVGGQVEVANDIGLSQKLVNTYSVILKSDRVMELVAEDLGLALPPSVLRQHVVVAPAKKDTEVLVVMVKNTDPGLAANICNSIMKVAPQAITGTVEVGSVNVVDYAKIPLYPEPPLTTRNVAVGALLGLMFGAGLIFLIRLFDNTVKNADDLRTGLGLATLGGIPYVKECGKKPRLTIDPGPDRYCKVGFGFVEAYKALRTNLLYAASARRSRKLLLASALHGEGKSTTAINLAIVLAQSGRNVLVIDCDLRSPSIHNVLDLQIEESKGLTRVLRGELGAEDAVICLEGTGISLLPAGPGVPNSTELLESDQMGRLLARLEKDYDYILMDTPPACLFADAVALSRYCDGVIFVVKQSYAGINTISSIVEDFKKAGTAILGCILNGVKYKEAGARYKYQDYDGYLSGYYREYGLTKGTTAVNLCGRPAGAKSVLLRKATSRWVFLPLIFGGLLLIGVALLGYLIPIYHSSKLLIPPAGLMPVAVGYGRDGTGTVAYPKFGEQYATLLLPSVGINRPVFFGDTKAQLRAGVGHFSGSNLPGEGGTIIYAGHNDLVFNKLKDVKPGDDVLIQTNYGDFRYRVFEAQVINGTNTVSLKPRGDKALLVMYTCYPIDVLGIKSDRYVVFAEQVLDYPVAPGAGPEQTQSALLPEGHTL